MKPIREAWCIQIEVNNVCPKSCAYCTRFNRHLRGDQRYHMPVGDLREILFVLNDALGYEGKIGLIGGEPTVHPDFEGVCLAVREEWTDKGRWAGLWTSGGNKYMWALKDIDKAFTYVAYNDKMDQRCHHQPMTMASGDIVADGELRAKLIDNCWVQRIWCPSITPKEVFFCECAAAWDRLLDGPGGWELGSDWLNYGPEDYNHQTWACQLCGMCVPMEQAEVDAKERISPSVLREMSLHGCERIGPEDFELDLDFVDADVVERRVRDGWAPGEYAPGRAKGGM